MKYSVNFSYKIAKKEKKKKTVLVYPNHKAFVDNKYPLNIGKF